MKVAVKRYYKYIAAVLICMLAALAACLAFTAGEVKVSADEPIAGYEIYPAPHEIVYGADEVELPEEINVRFGTDIDVYTVEHAYDTLALLDMLAYKDGDKTYTMYVGVAGSDDVADGYVKANGLTYKSGLFEKHDAYYLHVGADAIVVLGKTTDAAYYGISTLKYIFPQLTGRKIKKLDVNDWADTQYRGFLEGFYGIPWTADERIAVMEVGSAVKANMYMYAPKDDPYHAADWRSLYSAADLAELKVQIEAGKRTKVKFSWAIHPYQFEPITNATYNADLATLKNKFQQVYNAGVRNFIISGDDIDIDDPPPPALQRRLLNDIAEWLRSKGDCGELVYVPAAYCLDGHMWSLPYVGPYYEEFMDGLDPTVQIMWTGKKVTSSLKNGKFEEFTELTGRKPFVWLNWPVNDYAQDYLMLGPAEVLNVKYIDCEPAFTSLLFNPHVQAGPAVVPMFSVGDFCWNINAFDKDKSWESAIKFVEKNEYEAYMDICAQSTNTIHLFEDYSYGNQSVYDKVKEYPPAEYWTESADFVPLIEAFEAKIYSGQDVTAQAAALKARFDLLIEHCESFLENASNVMLRDRVRPWVNCLKYLAEECSCYLSVYMLPGTATDNDFKAAIDSAEAAHISRMNCTNYRLEYVTYSRKPHQIKIAPAVLTPFAQEVAIMANDEYCVRTGKYSGITFLGFNGVYHNEDPNNGMAVYTGTVDDAIDGDLNTFLWLDGRPTEKSFIRFDLGSVITLDDVHIYSGDPVNGRDVIYGDVEYSADGRVYTKLGDITGAETHIDRRLENKTGTAITARYLRLRPTGEGWVAIREMQWNTLNPLTCLFTYYGYEEYNVRINFPAGYSNILHVTDGDPSTYFDLKGLAGQDRILELEFIEPTTVRNIKLLTGDITSSNDVSLKSAVTQVKFMYSTDGVSYLPFSELCANDDGEYDLNCDEVEISYLRAVVTVNNVQDWVLVRLFEVSDEADASATGTLTKLRGIVTPHMTGKDESNIYVTGIGDGRDYTDPYSMCDGDYSTCAWITFDTTADTNFVLDLLETKTVYNIEFAQDLYAHKNEIFERTILSYSTDGTNYTTIGTYLGRDVFVALTTPITARYIKAQAVSPSMSHGVIVREFNVNVDRRISISGYAEFWDRSNTISDISYVTDGDPDTGYDMIQDPTNPMACYVIYDLGEEKYVNNVKILSGSMYIAGGASSLNSHITSCYLAFSTDGVTFDEIYTPYNSADGEYDITLGTVAYARYVRIRMNMEGYVFLREIEVGSPDRIVTAYMTGLDESNMFVTGLGPGYSDPSKMYDGDLGTCTWLTFDTVDEMYLILDLMEEQTVSGIYLAMANSSYSTEYFRDVIFSYSTDGVNYTDIDGTHTPVVATGGCEISLDLATNITARYIKARRVTKNPSNGVIIREFDATLVT